jgi:hypothetical protein
LVQPNASPWQTLYASGNIQAFITFLGFDKLTFDNLVSKFKPYFKTLSPHNTSNYMKSIGHQQIVGGATRTIDAKTCVALCLSYYRTKGPLYILQGWFGLTVSNICTWL